MTTMRWLGVLCLVAACGPTPRTPGAAPNQTYFWRVLTSEVVFGKCSDEAQFRMDLAPLKFAANSYVIYKADATGKTASTLTCDRVDPATCMPAPMQITFTVANPELIFTSTGKSALGIGGCQLQDTTTWLLVDSGPIGTLEIAHVLSEVDNPTACMAAEAQLKLQAPNKTGLEGCVVTFKVGLALNG